MRCWMVAPRRTWGDAAVAARRCDKKGLSMLVLRVCIALRQRLGMLSNESVCFTMALAKTQYR